ncbi:MULTISPECIES: hypothetical protein [unclassified Synechocystis]|uniref:hypothetical protein n=1 Tax=unclassified Synechocystis TaxID=2640012 RepID=UPI000404CBA7|nr:MULTISPECIES: hypothetical protein [unclassified Synechocystis]AIE72661.1 hypothetical protein D082_01320 [Synechocystis sp. PCC 6714]MCT0254675.1 hypothetical protein [Synechocystis sp. CS-94]
MKYRILAQPITILATVLILNACGNQTPSTDNYVTPTPTPSIAPTENVEENKTESHGGKGGQVIEIGDYHLELLAVKEAGGFHLDFYLQKGVEHNPLPDATVTGKIQLPDGTQQEIDFKYSDQDKHYTAILSTQVAGDYKLAILSDINGEKVNGRFNFKY